MILSQTGIELQSLAFDRDSATYRAEYDPTVTAASMAVVASLSEVMDVDPTELDPLEAFVDSEALDGLVGPAPDGGVSVGFPVAEYAVTVYSGGTVAIAPLAGDGPDDPVEGISLE